MAGIGNLPDTLQSRCITIKLRRKFINEQVERRNTVLRACPNLFNDLRRKIVRLVIDHEQELLKSDYVVPEDMDDRVHDNWLGLFKLARLIGEDEVFEAHIAAKFLSANDTEDQSENVLLLSDLRSYVTGITAESIKTIDLLSYLHTIDDRPWCNYNGRPLTAYKMSSMLRPFDIKSHLIRFEDKPMRGYRTEAFKDAFGRYV